MKEKLIDKDDVRNLHPIFKGWFGNLLLKMLFSLAGINKVNAIYDASKHLTGRAFELDLLDRLDITRQVENIDVLDTLPPGAFITVSNHPYGHVDGIILLSILTGVRADYKMMVNWMLNEIDTMQEHFIGVNPYSGNKMATLKSSLSGVKQCVTHLREGHPLGFFPAGAMSMPHLTKTEDREWQPAVLKIIRNANVPVVPVYISGNNSWFFRLLGLINWRVRTVRLLHEVHNKKGKTITIRFGKPVMPEEFAQFGDIKAFGEYLKQQTYALKKG